MKRGRFSERSSEKELSELGGASGIKNQTFPESLSPSPSWIYSADDRNWLLGTDIRARVPRGKKKIFYYFLNIFDSEGKNIWRRAADPGETLMRKSVWRRKTRYIQSKPGKGGFSGNKKRFPKSLEYKKEGDKQPNVQNTANNGTKEEERKRVLRPGRKPWASQV